MIHPKILCLVADDSCVVRKVSMRILESFGLECIEANNGQEAFDLCFEQNPDMVFLDWNMPVMSGIEFLEQLRASNIKDQPKVVFCTAENDMVHIERAMKAGADEYIMKPFDSDIIKTKLIQIGIIPNVQAIKV